MRWARLSRTIDAAGEGMLGVRRVTVSRACAALLVTGCLSTTLGCTSFADATAPDRSTIPNATDVLDGPAIGPADDPELHLMTFNLRVPVDESPNSWEDRRERVAAILNTERPTVIGTQEGWYEQVREVDQDLPDHYDWIGQGRDGGSRGDFMAIHYDSDRLDPLEYDHRWLSETPATIASQSWDSAHVRMLTWVRFADLENGGEFVVVNTHFDHVSDTARQRSGNLIRQTIAEFDQGLPVIVLGDFNAVAGDSPTWGIMTGDGGLVDTWQAADEQRTRAYETFTGFRPPVVRDHRIDWILATPDVSTHAAAINPALAEDGAHPSDHLPVQALIEVDRTR